MTLSITLYLALTGVLYVLAGLSAAEEDRLWWFLFCGAMAVWAAFNLYAINQ